MAFSKKNKPQEHTNNQSPSNEPRHDRGERRKLQDQNRSTNPNTQRGRANAQAKKDAKKKGNGKG